MTNCLQSPRFFIHRKKRRERVLRKMANMRAAKERKRLENPPEREPKMLPYYPLRFGVRDTRNGDDVWLPLRSGRDVAKRIAVLLRFYR